MSTESFDTGDTLSVNWDERQICVIQSDAWETFYEVDWYGSGWNMRRSRTCTFYRTPTKFLRTSSTLLGRSDFTDKELSKLRADLPMRLFRHGTTGWAATLSELLKLEIDYPIAASKLTIIPYGAKGGALKPRLVQVLDSTIRLSQVITEAYHAQGGVTGETVGVGMYRSGLVGGVPSYYLWGCGDRAGHAA